MSEKPTPTTGRLMRRLQTIGSSRGLRVALGMTSTICVAGGAAMGCLDRPIEPVEPRTTSTVVDVLTQSSVDKIDVLLVIDNSGSMGDKQAILADAVPKLVERLVTPTCVSAKEADKGQAADPPQTIDEDGKCPDGYEPEFKPVKDINIGIVSSSLGSAGTKRCVATTAGRNDDDKGELLWRTTPGTSNNDAPTYEDLGFLAWDPDQKRPCVGEAAGGEKCPGANKAGDLIGTLTTMVKGVGESGCGYEAPLEAAYRFLVDPKPYGSIDAKGAKVDVDQTLLDQRAAFLRPDSLLAVILLTDENDCSLRADGIGNFGGELAPPEGHAMPLARSECADNPDDECCASCIDKVPSGCSGDGGCPDPGNQAANSGNFYPAPADGDPVDPSNAELRCWDQKRRFGYDFLYPVERYVNAFSQLRVDPKKLDLSTSEGGGEVNPIFTDLQDLGRTIRPPDLVFFAGIVGVPWQLIARKNADKDPDLLNGINQLDPTKAAVGGFQSFDELEQNGVWKLLIPKDGTDQPDDPHMIETPFPRDDLSTDPDSDPINGNEWDTVYKDLQYACIFDLPKAAQKTCDPETGDGCTDCKTPTATNGNPLCDDANPLVQVRAKAYPGTRILQVLNGMRNQGIPASICPAQLDSPEAKDYGYTPAVFAIIDRLKTKLGGSCQPRQLNPNKDGDTPCIVIEARDSDGDKKASTTSQCKAACKGEGRAPIGDETKAAAEKIQADLDNEETDEAKAYDCLCEIVQLQGKIDDPKSDRHKCAFDEAPDGDIDGWCYVDATTVPPTGNPDLVSSCPPTEQRLVRFVNQGEVVPGGRLYVTCAGDAAGGE